MNEGERQGEIEVVQIDMQTEAVNSRTMVWKQLLNMKDDAEKPALGAHHLRNSARRTSRHSTQRAATKCGV